VPADAEPDDETSVVVDALYPGDGDDAGQPPTSVRTTVVRTTATLATTTLRFAAVTDRLMSGSRHDPDGVPLRER